MKQARLAALTMVIGLSAQAPPAPQPLVVTVSGGKAAAVAVVAPPPDARAIFSERCVVCHGESGNGDGPAAAGMMVKPRRFADAIWQDGVSDDHIAKAILEGGFAVKKSSAMPAHPDLKPKVLGLVTLIRSFRAKGGTALVEARAADGALVASGTAELDAKGNATVALPGLRAGSYALTARASGMAEPWCATHVDVDDATRSAKCAPSAPPPPAVQPIPVAP